MTTDIDFDYEGCEPRGRGEAIDGGTYIFRPREDLGLMGKPPFRVAADNYDEAVKKLHTNIKGVGEIHQPS